MMHGNTIPLLHDDGSRIFQSPEMLAAQREVAQGLAKRWKCEIHDFPPLCPIDWYSERYGRMVSLLELKCRYFASNKYPTTFLSVNKWFHLMRGSDAFGIPAIYVVRFTDGACWVPVRQIEARHQRVITNKEGNREPVIDVPVNQFGWVLRGGVDGGGGVGAGGDVGGVEGGALFPTYNKPPAIHLS